MADGSRTRRSHEPVTLCPIDRAASVFCDRWTMLILRELRLGNDRFDGIQAQTLMSSNLLARRLKAMEADGLIERRPYQQRPRRYAYAATAKTLELDGMMLMLRQWGMRHGGFAPGSESAVRMVYRRTGETIGPDWQAPDTDGPFSFEAVESRINPGWAAERAARAEAFERTRRSRVATRTRSKG